MACAEEVLTLGLGFGSILHGSFQLSCHKVVVVGLLSFGMSNLTSEISVHWSLYLSLLNIFPAKIIPRF